MKPENKKTEGRKKIFLVDDHPLMREGLARALASEKDMVVCGEAGDAAEALKAVESLHPDLAIVDLSMEGMNGLELIQKIREKNGKLRILVLSTHKESLYAEKSLKAGANGYVMKRESRDTLMAAIRTVTAGRTYLTHEMNQAILDKVTNPGKRADDPEGRLSVRELETFRLIGQGLGSRQIAETLHISMKTVEAHREHIRAKFGMDSNYQLVQKAIAWVHQQSHFL